jgi:Ca-activated chloride channel family protein
VTRRGTPRPQRPQSVKCSFVCLAWVRTVGSATLLVATTFAGATSTSAVAHQTEQTIESGRIVRIFTTVTDAQKRLVTSLTKDDFEILDNEKPQPLILFQSDVQPITVIVMIDRSGSVTGTSGASVQLTAAVEGFLRLLTPQDQARASAFSDQIQFTSHFTSNRDDVIGELQNFVYGNGTKLFDALLASLDELKGRQGRRAVVVITDGDDTLSHASRSTVIERERADEAIVYVIGLHTELFNGRRKVRKSPSRDTADLAEETGGGYFEAQKPSDVAPMMVRIAQELHGQYVLGFAPTQLDGRVHKLTVHVKQRGLTARARRSYSAATIR